MKRDELTDKPDTGEDLLAAAKAFVYGHHCEHDCNLDVIGYECVADFAQSQLSDLRAKLSEVERERDEAKQRAESYREEAAELHRLVDDHFQQRTKRNREFAALRAKLAEVEAERDKYQQREQKAWGWLERFGIEPHAGGVKFSKTELDKFMRAQADSELANLRSLLEGAIEILGDGFWFLKQKGKWEVKLPNKDWSPGVETIEQAFAWIESNGGKCD